MTIGESVHIRDQGRQRNVQGRTQDPQFYLNETAIAPFIPGHQATLPSSVNIQPVDDSEGNSAVALHPPCNISEAACWRRFSTDTNMF